MNTHTVMNKILPFALLISLMIPPSVMATGPRVTAHLLSQGMEIYALDLPPFISTEIGGGGFDAEIVNAALKAAGIDASISSLPLENMVKYYLTQENAVAVLGHHLSFSDKQREDLIFIPISVTRESYFYYQPAQKSVLNWNGKLKNLKGYTYGARKGENVMGYKEAGIHIVFGKPRSLLKKLKSKEIDFIKLPDLTAEWMVDKYFPEDKTNYSPMKTAIAEKPTFIIFNKKHSEGEGVAKKFRTGLSKIIEDGRYLAIVEKYQSEEKLVEKHMKNLRSFSD